MKNNFLFVPLILAVLVCGLLLIGGCGSGHSSASFDSVTVSSLEAVMQVEMASAEASGMILYIDYPGHGQFISARGTSNVATGDPMNIDYQYRIGSISKTFTGLVILQLVDEGLVKLTDTIDKYVTGVPSGDVVTIKELLSHTSGLPEYTSNPDFWNAVSANKLRHFTSQDLLDYGWALPMQSAPGTVFSYCNTNFILLGKVIESVSPNHESVESAINRRVIDRLQLTHTFFPTAETFTQAYIHGYHPVGLITMEDWSLESPSYSGAAGGIISTVPDLAKYVKALYDGTLVSAATQNQRLSEWTDTGYPFYQYGLGWLRMWGFYGHNGSIPGYVNHAVYDPTTGMTIVLMLNSDRDENATNLTLLRVLRILLPGRS